MRLVVAAALAVAAAALVLVNFRALAIKFINTCLSMDGSPVTSGSEAIVHDIWRACKSSRRSARMPRIS